MILFRVHCRITIHIGQAKKDMRNRIAWVIVKLLHQTPTRKETLSLMSKSITQDMAYRHSLMKYTGKYGVSRASRKHNKSRSYIYFWRQRWDGSVASLACQSRRPHSHPNQHTEAELKLIRDMRRRNPKLGMIELWHRLRLRGYKRLISIFICITIGCLTAKPSHRQRSAPRSDGSLAVLHPHRSDQGTPSSGHNSEF